MYISVCIHIHVYMCGVCIIYINSINLLINKKLFKLLSTHHNDIS